MNDAIELIRTAVLGLDARSLVDILVVAVIVYGLLTLIQGTTAVPLLRGMAPVFLAGVIVSSVLGLSVLGWLLRNSLPALLVAIPILFQPELRRALERVGRAREFLPWPHLPTPGERAIEEIARAASGLAQLNWGALIVLEREIPLGEYASSAVRIDAEVSEQLLMTIFSPHSPLHDGAVILHGNRILAAGCVLPLPDLTDGRHGRSGAREPGGSREFGMRHRAGMEITEKTDAVSVIVSEETGRISLSNRGRIVSSLDGNRLERLLSLLYRPRVQETATPPRRFGLPTLLR